MEALLKLAKRAQKLNEGKVFKLVFSDPEIKDLVVELNTFGQLGIGLFPDGTELQDYSDVSLDLFDKPTIGSQSNHSIRLYDTGDFYRTFEVSEVSENFIIINADSDIHGNDLIEKYGDVLGLSVESIEIIVKEIVPKIVKYVIEYLLQDN
jgi:hypothetical protein